MKAKESGGMYTLGCVVTESLVFLKPFYFYSPNVLYNVERGFVERELGTNGDIRYVMPRIRTPTGPNTVMTVDERGLIDIYDIREESGLASRSMTCGLQAGIQLSWHPSNPDLIAVCGGRNAQEIKVLSVSQGTEVATLPLPDGYRARGVGIYGDTVAAGAGDVLTYKMGVNGNKSVGRLEHATIAPHGCYNMHLYHDRGVFATSELYIACFKY